MKKIKKIFLSLSLFAAVPLPIILTSCDNKTTTSVEDKDDNNSNQSDTESNDNNNSKDSTNESTNSDNQNPSVNVKDVVTLVKSAMQLFNTWDLFPPSFDAENRIVNYSQQDFSKDVTLANITNRGIGKQMNQFMVIVSNIETIIKGTKTIFDATSLIANMYKTFFDKDPEKNKIYESSTENNNVKFRVELINNMLIVFAKAASASAEFYLNLTDNSYSGRLQLSDGNALKYEISKNKIKVGIKALGALRMMLEVDSLNANQKIAKLFNYYGTNNDYKNNDESDGSGNNGSDNDIGLTTCSIMSVEKDYVSIIGKKGDFLSWSKDNRNMEVYDAKTGNYVGSKVYEKLSKLQYMTNWYPFQSINGINSIKQLTNSENKDNNGFYLNNLSTPFKEDKTLSMTTGYSRGYDIETKKVYLYQKNNKNNTDKFSVTIPMLFMQDSYEKDSSKGFNELNKQNPGLNLSNKTSTSLKTFMTNKYDNLNAEYNLYNESIQNTTVDSYVGTQSNWFN